MPTTPSLHRAGALSTRAAPTAALVAPEAWAAAAILSPAEVDCITAAMLKILDGKCKMDSVEKRIMERLYDACSGRAGMLLGGGYHALVGTAREDCGDGMRARVYEQRVLAETVISRPVMKGFKARLRREGVLPTIAE